MHDLGVSELLNVMEFLTFCAAATRIPGASWESANKATTADSRSLSLPQAMAKKTCLKEARQSFESSMPAKLRDP